MLHFLVLIGITTLAFFGSDGLPIVGGPALPMRQPQSRLEPEPLVPIVLAKKTMRTSLRH